MHKQLRKSNILIIRKESFLYILQVILKREVYATSTKTIKITSKISRVYIYNALNFSFVLRLTRNR